jgi:hypothetical protein
VTRYQPGIRQLTLRLVIPDFSRLPDEYPVVSILIDGREMLPGADKCGYVGSPPAAILDTDAPLLPVSTRRRIAVSGTPGCGYVAPVISSARRKVVWSDFRAFVELEEPPYVQPEEVSSGWPGWPLDFPDLTFDADQYADEVRRISAEREWESAGWQAALLLDEFMHPGDPWSPWEFSSAEPRGDDSFEVICLDSGPDRGIAFTLFPPPGPPGQRARWMADYLLTTPAERWPVARRFGPDDQA